MAKEYLETLVNDDIPFEGVERDPAKMQHIIRSLARNESTNVSKKALEGDRIENQNELPIANNTLDNYLSVLERLHFTDFQYAFDPNMRSSVRVGKTPKRHLADPSLTATARGSNTESYLNDLNMIGPVRSLVCPLPEGLCDVVRWGQDAFRDRDSEQIQIV